MSPYILFENNIYNIILEDNIFISSNNIIDSYLLLICIYFIFDLKYHLLLKNSLVFIQKMLIDHQDNSPQNLKIINLYTKIVN